MSSALTTIIKKKGYQGEEGFAKQIRPALVNWLGMWAAEMTGCGSLDHLPFLQQEAHYK